MTFLNLALFWYSQGSWRRSYILKTNAIQIGYILGLGIEKPGKENSLEFERRRRRFWACHLISCHSSESLYTAEPSETTLKLTLPWTEGDFDVGISTRPQVSLGSGKSNGGAYCELIKVMTLW